MTRIRLALVDLRLTHAPGVPGVAVAGEAVVAIYTFTAMAGCWQTVVYVGFAGHSWENIISFFLIFLNVISHSGKKYRKGKKYCATFNLNQCLIKNKYNIFLASHLEDIDIPFPFRHFRFPFSPELWRHCMEMKILRIY